MSSIGDEHRINSLARDYSDQNTLAELEAMVSRCNPGSEQHSGVLVAIQRKKDTAQAAADQRDDQIRAEAHARSDRQHQTSIWWTRFSASFGALGFGLALVGFLAGRYWPTAQVSSLELRLAAIEKQLESAKPSPRPSALPSIQTEQQSSAILPAPSNAHPVDPTAPEPKKPE